MSDARHGSSFPFRFEPLFRRVGLVFGVRPATTGVDLVGPHMIARMGPWAVVTAISNVASLHETGPYHAMRTVGPARVSLRDGGLTFATTTSGGVCVGFLEPIVGSEPFHVARHSSLTVTVDDPKAFIAAVRAAQEQVEVLERDEHDVLASRTAAELRAVARAVHVPRASSMRKPELVESLNGVLQTDEAVTVLEALDASGG